VTALQGHEVCADIHTALSVAQAVLTSRNERVADRPEADSTPHSLPSPSNDRPGRTRPRQGSAGESTSDILTLAMERVRRHPD